MLDSEVKALQGLRSEDYAKVNDVLADAVKRVTGQARAQVDQFVVRFGPPALRWAAQSQAARAAGDTRRAEELELDLKELLANARMKAARLGVVATAEGEKFVVVAVELLTRTLALTLAA